MDGAFVCAEPDARYCAGESLATNIIIRCSGTVGRPGNCNDKFATTVSYEPGQKLMPRSLAGIPPVGVKSFAPCYQSSPTAGDASCSYDGTVYPDDGSAPFPVPSKGDSHSSETESSSYSYGGSMTTLTTHYTTGTVTQSYTVTVPCSTTTAATTHPPIRPTSYPPPTIIETSVTVSDCHPYCPSSSTVPTIIVPPTSATLIYTTSVTLAPPTSTYLASETPGESTYPAPPAPSAPTYSASDTPEPTFSILPVPADSTYPPVAPPATTLSTISSVVVVEPTPAPGTSGVPAAIPGTSTSSASAQQFTGAAAKNGNSFAGAAVIALAAVAVV